MLTLMAADKMDREGNKAARDLIAAAKIVVPKMARRSSIGQFRFLDGRFVSGGNPITPRTANAVKDGRMQPSCVDLQGSDALDY